MDLYHILGVTYNSSEKDIRKAYKELALKYHPDKNKDLSAEERFKDITRAYNVLSHPDRRRQYDLTGNPNVEVEIEEIIQIERYDFVAEVNYEDLVLGATKNIKAIEEIMIDSDGIEVIPLTCPMCSGKIKISRKIRITCGYCNGTGEILPRECKPAEIFHDIDIIIEPASWIDRIIIHEGKRIMLKPIEGPKSRFRNEYNLLIYSYPITVYHALIGLVKEVKILDKIHKIDHIDPIMPDSHLVIEGAGLYDSKGKRHDLIIEFDILFPSHISEEQRSCLERCIDIDRETSDV